MYHNVKFLNDRKQLWKCLAIELARFFRNCFNIKFYKFTVLDVSITEHLVPWFFPNTIVSYAKGMSLTILRTLHSHKHCKRHFDLPFLWSDILRMTVFLPSLVSSWWITSQKVVHGDTNTTCQEWKMTLDVHNCFFLITCHLDKKKTILFFTATNCRLVFEAW